MTGPLLDDVCQSVGQSRKYQAVAPEAVVRIARWAIQSGASAPKEAAKKAKRKLHQVHGLYMDAWNPKAAESLAGQLAESADSNSRKAICREIMALHASTRERLDSLDEFYERIFQISGRPESILDLACGLHPFSLPWMNLPAAARYSAYEMDGELVDAVNRFFREMEMPGGARRADLLSRVPDESADLAFLLQALPCLERQQPGAGFGLLAKLNARWIVVSFPLKSVGGHAKGMRENYSGQMQQWLNQHPKHPQNPWPATKLEIGHELIFVLQKPR